MTREEITEYLGRDWEGTVGLMKSSLVSGINLLDSTNSMLLANSGKQLRPVLSLLMAKALGEPDMDSWRYAAACELFHNATLMHDDVADSSTQRRGKPTVSALLGNGPAVLIGDYWLAKAVNLIVSSDNYKAVTELFARTLTDLAEGEMLQMEKASSCDTTEDDYYRIIYSKTASLFVTSVCSGALSVNASDDMLEAARNYGRCLGIAFQIKDDILDYEGTDRLGKPVGVDLREQKITLPLLGAISGSPQEDEIRHKVQTIAGHPEYYDEIRGFVRENGGIEYAYTRLEEHVKGALDALEALPESRARQMLRSLAEYNLRREV